MYRIALLVLFAFAACADPIAPEPIASQWALNAWAGDDYGHGCRITGDVGVEGTVDDFAGTANLALSITDNGTTADMGIVGAAVRGTAEAVEVGSYRFAVHDRQDRMLLGTWQCGELLGVWYMGPPVQAKH